MKHLLLAAALLVLGSFAQAQSAGPANTFELPLTQGHTQIGGNVYWSNLGGSDYSSLNISPKAEFFIANNFSLGGAINLFFSKYSDTDYGDGSNNFKLRSYGLAPSATYYFWKGAGMATYINQQIALTIPNSGSTSFGGATGLGIGFFLNQHVSIAPEFDATYANYTRGALSFQIAIAAYL